MSIPVKSVVIVGGGSAGWMTAAYLSKALQGTVRITLVESPSVSSIGVGEATVPNLQRVFFDYLGIPEEEWMRECNASLKVAVKFVNWRGPAAGRAPDAFYHTFGLLPNVDGVPLSHYWLRRRQAGDQREYAYSCLIEPPLLNAKASPIHLDGRRVTHYAWHFSADLVAAFLQRLSTSKQGVVHIKDDVDQVALDDRGFIASLKLRSGRVLTGDLFVDCTGFKGLLINKALGEPFIDMSDYLLCDGAIAAQIPHDDDRFGVEPYTSAIAMRNGWTWKIPMLGRFGSGYVYSSRHTTMDEAARDFCELWNVDENAVRLNRIRFRVGRNRRAWVKNCVGIGLSSCFLEPLESTGLYFIYASIYQLVKHFPDRSFDPLLLDRFNREVEFMFDDCRDFVQAHYVVSPRRDTPFWLANRHELRLSDNFKEKRDTYESGLPLSVPTTSPEAYYGHFELEFRNFWTNHSYYCIFSGLGCYPKQTLPLLGYKPESCEKAELLFADIAARQSELVRSMPSMRDWLRHLHAGSDATERDAALVAAKNARRPPAMPELGSAGVTAV